jgi:hypothetical protein
VGTAAGRTIVAVNSGAGGGTQTLARVDLVKAKIDRIIAENGGPLGSASPACSGAPETEPNDDPAGANAIAGARCGRLSPGDVDWFTWDVPRAGVSYDIELDAGGDAELSMWKATSAGWLRIRNTSPTRFTARSSGPGRYLFAVHSGARAAQPYKVTLTK